MRKAETNMAKQSTQPIMTTVANRPTLVLHEAQPDMYVQCRTAKGEDVHVPLKSILEHFYLDMQNQLRAAKGR